MENRFENHVRKVHLELTANCVLRHQTEMKQQIMLSKSIYLSRFIKIASLDRMRNGPEMDDARRFLVRMFPEGRSKLRRSGFSEVLKTIPEDFRMDN